MQGVDSVLYCTGYQYAYPWLAPPDLLRTEGMRVDPLYKHVLHPVLAPTLAFVGLLWKNVPYPQMEMQVRTLTSVCARCCCWLCLAKAALQRTSSNLPRAPEGRCFVCKPCQSPVVHSTGACHVSKCPDVMCSLVRL